jgi:ERCC4-related helicase
MSRIDIWDFIVIPFRYLQRKGKQLKEQGWRVYLISFKDDTVTLKKPNEKRMQTSIIMQERRKQINKKVDIIEQESVSKSNSEEEYTKWWEEKL